MSDETAVFRRPEARAGSRARRDHPRQRRRAAARRRHARPRGPRRRRLAQHARAEADDAQSSRARRPRRAARFARPRRSHPGRARRAARRARVERTRVPADPRLHTFTGYYQDPRVLAGSASSRARRTRRDTRWSRTISACSTRCGAAARCTATAESIAVSVGAGETPAWRAQRASCVPSTAASPPGRARRPPPLQQWFLASDGFLVLVRVRRQERASARSDRRRHHSRHSTEEPDEAEKQAKQIVDCCSGRAVRARHRTHRRGARPARRIRPRIRRPRPGFGQFDGRILFPCPAACGRYRTNLHDDGGCHRRDVCAGRLRRGDRRRADGVCGKPALGRVPHGSRRSARMRRRLPRHPQHRGKRLSRRARYLSRSVAPPSRRRVA